MKKTNILEHVQEVSAYLEEKLDSLAAKYDFITDRRGMGLMQGLVFDRPVAPLINAALENGLILINAGTNIIRFVCKIPPLVITDADVDEMIEKRTPFSKKKRRTKIKKTVIFLFLILGMTAVNTGCQKKQETDFILENPKEHTDNEKQTEGNKDIKRRKK